MFMLSALPTPKGIMKHIRSIQRDILWGTGEEKKKVGFNILGQDLQAQQPWWLGAS